MSILLPFVLFLTWFALAVVSAGKLAIEDEARNAPKSERRGTSIFPSFPIYPLIAWGIAVLLDRRIAPWGSWSLLIIHLIVLLCSVFIITRDLRDLRRARKIKAESSLPK
jgi:hypothetical protein